MHVDVQIPPFEENSSGDRLSGGFFIHRATQNPHYSMTIVMSLSLSGDYDIPTLQQIAEDDIIPQL